KSATGNTILRREAFKSKVAPCSETRECQKEMTEFNRRRITVIHTPGLFDTGVDNVETRKEIVKCVSMAAPGPHVFLLVIQLGRFTQEEKDAVKMIQDMFGDKSRMYTMVLFTRGDDLRGKRIQEFIEDDANLQYLIHQCGKRYHVFNNKDTKDQTQVSELLDKIDCMVAVNGGNRLDGYLELQSLLEPVHGCRHYRNFIGAAAGRVVGSFQNIVYWIIGSRSQR
uniref:GTPase IMAP family member 8 n=1 Tax=Sinocyclocheilus grahami TaxID=75366 RepID=A0A672JST7_SINGR